ncbi:hypothetical protein ISJ10_09285 [Burkholderia pseudomallei]|uniref:hypothetical protein n=1 Tax=Burkholderia pseudomallei TaxID=28450 RepID=UPI000E727485|nr:hypothetical protein [Burkholderia pseudomallei]AYE29322.1 hypothetical protein CNX72_19805 [Burkholderia pseudomallei]MBF3778993.1 hypothetical protein [Burkholderia pseudomallei]MBF4060253.1 hypothetical protein [Burkholderia pseudomallei]MBF4078351.1 hypothetical protein [Burkholderia pseudomallei]
MSNSNVVPLALTGTPQVPAAFLAHPVDGLNRQVSNVNLARQFNLPHARVLHEIRRFSMWERFSQYFVADTYLSHGREYPCFLVSGAVMLPLTWELPGNLARAWHMRCMDLICAVADAAVAGMASKADRRTAWELLEVSKQCSAARATIKQCRKAGRIT